MPRFGGVFFACKKVLYLWEYIRQANVSFNQKGVEPMKYILKEIVSRNGLGTDTYERYARWANPTTSAIIGFDTYKHAKMVGDSSVKRDNNGIVDFKVEIVE